MRNLKNAELVETERRMVVVRAGGWGKQLLVKEYKLPVWGDENALEMDGGDSGTNL